MATDYVQTRMPTKLGTNHDRFTLVLQATYLDFELQQATNARWAIDRLVTGKDGAYQSNMRVNPGNKVPIPLPGHVPGTYEILLGHRMPEVQVDNEDFKEQIRKNTIEVWDIDGKLVGSIGVDRIMFGQFAGPLLVSSTRATAILNVNVFPL